VHGRHSRKPISSASGKHADLQRLRLIGGVVSEQQVHQSLRSAGVKQRRIARAAGRVSAMPNVVQR
jgi:hypothetical protein